MCKISVIRFRLLFLRCIFSMILGVYVSVSVSLPCHHIVMCVYGLLLFMLNVDEVFVLFSTKYKSMSRSRTLIHTHIHIFASFFRISRDRNASWQHSRMMDALQHEFKNDSNRKHPLNFHERKREREI